MGSNCCETVIFLFHGVLPIAPITSILPVLLLYQSVWSFGPFYRFMMITSFGTGQFCNTIEPDQ